MLLVLIIGFFFCESCNKLFQQWKSVIMIYSTVKDCRVYSKTFSLNQGIVGYEIHIIKEGLNRIE